MSKRKTKLDVPNHECAFVVFVDPAFSSGWTGRGDEPNIEDIIHFGCGVITGETKTTITIALMAGLFDKDKTLDMLNPFTMHKEKGILCLYRFTWEDFNDKGKRCKWIKRQIERNISEFIEEGKERYTETCSPPEPLHKPS